MNASSMGVRLRRSWRARATLIVSLTLLAAALGVQATAALFTSTYPVQGSVTAGRIFPGERDTAAFHVTDASAGNAIDASNAIAYDGDGLVATSAPWSTVFGADRYLEFVMNDPLPTGLSLASSSFRLTWSTTAGSTACFYFEVRDEVGDVLEAHGSPGTPVGCVSGTSLTSVATPLVSLSGTTEINGVRVRVFASDSAAGPTTIDSATVQGDYGLSTFTLYPVELVDVADTSPATFHWGPAGP